MVTVPYGATISQPRGGGTVAIIVAVAIAAVAVVTSVVIVVVAIAAAAVAAIASSGAYLSGSAPVECCASAFTATNCDPTNSWSRWGRARGVPDSLATSSNCVAASDLVTEPRDWGRVTQSRRRWWRWRLVVRTSYDSIDSVGDGDGGENSRSSGNLRTQRWRCCRGGWGGHWVDSPSYGGDPVVTWGSVAPRLVELSTGVTPSPSLNMLASSPYRFAHLNSEGIGDTPISLLRFCGEAVQYCDAVFARLVASFSSANLYGCRNYHSVL